MRVSITANEDGGHLIVFEDFQRELTVAISSDPVIRFALFEDWDCKKRLTGHIRDTDHLNHLIEWVQHDRIDMPTDRGLEVATHD